MSYVWIKLQKIECLKNSSLRSLPQGFPHHRRFFLCINYNFLPTGSQPNCALRDWNPIKNRSVLFFMLCRAVLKQYWKPMYYAHTQTKYVFLGYITLAKLAGWFLIRFGGVAIIAKVNNKKMCFFALFLKSYRAYTVLKVPANS